MPRREREALRELKDMGSYQDEILKQEETMKINFEDYREYMTKLRDSGKTNMFGADRYLLRDHPGLTKAEAREITIWWIERGAESA
jgi:hypothetical protein